MKSTRLVIALISAAILFSSERKPAARHRMDYASTYWVNLPGDTKVPYGAANRRSRPPLSS